MHPHWECLAAEPNFGIKWLIELLHTQVHEGFSLLTYAYCAHFGDLGNRGQRGEMARQVLRSLMEMTGAWCLVPAGMGAEE